MHSRFFCPHSFRQVNKKSSGDELETTFSVFHNNVVSLSRNLENLQTHLLCELQLHLNIIEVTETKITNSNLHTCTAQIPGYVFECVPTPLAPGSVGMFIKESFNYRILEKTTNEAFQALSLTEGRLRVFFFFFFLAYAKLKTLNLKVSHVASNSPRPFLAEQFLGQASELCVQVLMSRRPGQICNGLWLLTFVMKPLRKSKLSNSYFPV